jgi:signal transduction histidine kinase
VLLPELLARHLGGGGNIEYEVEVVTRGNPPRTVYRSGGDPSRPIADTADASAGLLGSLSMRPGFPPPPGQGPRAGEAGRADAGRWQLFVRHRSGSLDVVVSRARWRNLAVIAGILTLMLLTGAALVRYTRKAQKLAEMQMDFVAGVSHEFRTPLTVISTSAYNLRGRVANNPAQVERYGTMIRSEAEKLTALVEQVLAFASVKAGQVIRDREPVSVESVIEDSLDSSKALLEGAHCVVERNIDAGLPLILGDPMALRRVVQNLVSNAAKYGTEGSHWIGIFASKGTGETPEVEIRVADRGPGIPAGEQPHIFDPFYRGRRALQDQIHGTGLGLSLVKAIVEAHGGTIAVVSQEAKGTEFVIRIPAAPPEYQDEFTHFDRRG